MPTPTPKPFALDQLPGFLIYSSRYGINQHINIAFPDWSSTKVLIPHSTGMADYPVWSPTGRYIAYSYFEMEKGLYSEIRLYEFDSNNDSSLTPQHVDGTVSCLSWAPDERYVVFDLLQDGTNDRELYLIDIETREVVNLTNSAETLDQDPAWSPAGDVIAFASDQDRSTSGRFPPAGMSPR